MPALPQHALDRLERLQFHHRAARVQQDSLRQELDHWQLQLQKVQQVLEQVAQPYGGLRRDADGYPTIEFQSYTDGRPQRYVVRAKRKDQAAATAPAPVAPPPTSVELQRYFDDWSRARERVEQFRQQCSVAGERAAQFRAAIDTAEELMRSRGWRREL